MRKILKRFRPLPKEEKPEPQKEDRPPRLRCINPDCREPMILVMEQPNNNPVTGKPMILQTWHCPKCMIIAKRAIPVDRSVPGWKLQAKEALERLGYL